MKLHELHINNFKFFPKQDPKSPLLKIEGKNLLIYGENGSGKSTIYWALYTLLESAFKKNEIEVEKYFKKNGEFGLVNIHATKSSAPFIKAVLKDNNGNNPKEYLVNPNLHQIVANMNDTTIRESGMASDFLNYRVIFRLHHIKHSKENNLFGWFEDEIFPYILIDTISRTESVEDNYKSLKAGPKKVKDFNEIDKMIYPNPDMREHPQEAVRKDYVIYQKYIKSIKNWNVKIEKYLKNISERANVIVKDDFKQNFDFKLKFTGANHVISADKFEWKEPYVELQVPKYEGKRNVVKRAHSFLNEAKWSAIGLAIRFAIIEDWTNRPNTAELKALIIDDMLLSLDMCNRDIVLNLLLDRYVTSFQMIILTHDRYFYEITQGKINARNKGGDWLKLEMYEDEKNGKKFPLIIKSKTNLEKARSFYKQKEFPAAANHLRKATECFVYEYVPKKHHYDKRFNDLNLSQLINKSRAVAKINGLPDILIQELDLMRTNIFNPGSHYDVYTPIFQNDLIRAIETLEQISQLTNLNL
jgi:energy-coupling factor transporter ATP-binding protein EcfA2